MSEKKKQQILLIPHNAPPLYVSCSKPILKSEVIKKYFCDRALDGFLLRAAQHEELYVEMFGLDDARNFPINGLATRYSSYLVDEFRVKTIPIYGPAVMFVQDGDFTNETLGRLNSLIEAKIAEKMPEKLQKNVKQVQKALDDNPDKNSTIAMLQRAYLRDSKMYGSEEI